MIRLTICAVLCCLVSGCCKTQHPEHVLWYDKAARAWEEMLPLGNGRLGMMTSGDVDSEMLILNEISLWSGCERDYANPDAAQSLPQIRELLLAGDNVKAQEVMYERFVPRKAVDEQSYGSYQVLAGLILDYDYPADSLQSQTGYRRWLDLRDAAAYTCFGLDGVEYTRRYYVDRVRDVMVVELEADKKDCIGFEATLYRPEATTEIIEDGIVRLSGELSSGVAGVQGMKYSAYAAVVTSGDKDSIHASETSITVNGADKAWIVISAATSYFEGDDYDKAALERLHDVVNGAKNRDFRKMYSKSRKEYRGLYDRIELHIKSDAGTENLTTDKRIEEYSKGAADNSLAVLYYNYGRYLLISSTRPGSLPPNLQGLWANTRHTPWNGDYHTNINVQMNHWIAEPGNLSELHLPLTDLVMNLIPSGTRTAKDFYGPEAEGWV